MCLQNSDLQQEKSKQQKRQKSQTGSYPKYKECGRVYEDDTRKPVDRTKWLTETAGIGQGQAANTILDSLERRTGTDLQE
jgi:hypothetical protein